MNLIKIFIKLAKTDKNIKITINIVRIFKRINKYLIEEVKYLQNLFILAIYLIAYAISA
jgi:hypothetical protein